MNDFLKTLMTGPLVDMWFMNGKKHIFGYWPEGEVAGPDNPPAVMLELPILSDGNYPGNPGWTEFQDYLDECKENPQLLCIDVYRERFCS